MKKERSGPKAISDLFKVYQQRIKAPEGAVITVFIEIIDEVLNLTMQTEQVAYTPATRILTIKKGGPLKTEILLQKKELLAHLQGRLGVNSAPKDII